MKVFIVYWHPEPQSFNAAMLQNAAETFEQLGHEVLISNLHTMGFNPLSGRANFVTIKDPDYFKQQIEEMHATASHGFAKEIENEIAKIEWCELLLWQFPLWWFGLPAALKGWVDRVFAMGRTYGNGRFYENGVFKGKKALLSLTTGGPEGAYTHDGFNGDIQGILRPIQRGMLEFVGFSVLRPHIVYGPAHLSDKERTGLLYQYVERLKKIETENPIDAGTYS